MNILLVCLIMVFVLHIYVVVLVETLMLKQISNYQLYRAECGTVPFLELINKEIKLELCIDLFEHCFHQFKKCFMYV